MKGLHLRDIYATCAIWTTLHDHVDSESLHQYFLDFPGCRVPFVLQCRRLIIMVHYTVPFGTTTKYFSLTDTPREGLGMVVFHFARNIFA